MADWVDVRIPKEIFEGFERRAAGKRVSTNQEIVSLLRGELTGTRHRVEFVKEFTDAMRDVPTEHARDVAMRVVTGRPLAAATKELMWLDTNRA